MKINAHSIAEPAEVGDIDQLDREIVRLSQTGLAITERPYRTIALQLGLTESEVITRMEAMLHSGTIRRIGAVPNHYRLGYLANGMTVWDVPDAKAVQLGDQIGQLEFVSHCYLRPRHMPIWPYNLFAMVHARSREEATIYIDKIRQLLGQDCLASDVLYSSKILKKTGLRI